MDSAEAWKRTQYADHVLALKTYIKLYDSGELTPEELGDAVSAWIKNQKKPNYDPNLAENLRREWVEHGDTQIFAEYSSKGMSFREMGKICGVSAAAISRWLDGSRTRRS